jgi:hypothetical protein
MVQVWKGMFYYKKDVVAFRLCEDSRDRSSSRRGVKMAATAPILTERSLALINSA